MVKRMILNEFSYFGKGAIGKIIEHIQKGGFKKAMGVADADQMSQDEFRAAAVDTVKKLSLDLGIPQRLRDVNVPEGDLQALAASAFVDGNTAGNPRDVSVDDIFGVFETAY